MSICFQCPGCEKKLKAKDKLAGKRVKCPGCGHVILVPGQVASRSLETMVSALFDEAESVRMAAGKDILNLAATNQRDRVVECFINLLRDPRSWARQTAAAWLGALKAHRAAEALDNALRDPDYAVRDAVEAAFRELEGNIRTTWFRRDDGWSCSRCQQTWGAGKIRLDRRIGPYDDIFWELTCPHCGKVSDYAMTEGGVTKE
jgi:ssDNA-binding Zn-finger/Zn-ribbon topoisomerase 1